MATRSLFGLDKLRNLRSIRDLTSLKSTPAHLQVGVQRRSKFVSSSFDQREAIRKARRDIFGQFPRLKFGPEGHSMKKELRKRPYGPALS